MVQVGMSKMQIEQFLKEKHFDYTQAEMIAELMEKNNKQIEEAIYEIIKK